MNIPLVDLKKQHQNLKTELQVIINDVFESTAFIGGKYIEYFEKNFSEFVNAKNSISCSSGTTALHLALLSCDIGKDDEVITVANTFFATVEAILQCNATPVFVDIDEATFNIDSKKIEAAITKKTKAILVVHMYGQSVDIDPIREIAQKYSLRLIEDAAQAHGALYKNNHVGTMSDVACFSFYPGKNLGACGDAGMVVCNDDQKAKTIRILRDHGRQDKYEHIIPGYNYRMDGIQAAILNVKLKYLQDWVDSRNKIATLYKQYLPNENIKHPIVHQDNCHAYHLYVIKVKKRKELQEYLKSKGVVTGIHYPIPLHLQPACKFLNYKSGDLPITENVAHEILSLPIYPELSQDQIQYISEQITNFFSAVNW